MDAVQDVHDFVSRTIRVAVESSDSSPDTVLIAQLLCGMADGDGILIEELCQTIKERHEAGDSFERVEMASQPFNIVHFAAIAPNAKSLEKVLLLEKVIERVCPIDVSARSSSRGAANGATPLHLCAARGLYSEAKILITAGADPRAIRQKHISVVHDCICALERALPSAYYLYAQRHQNLSVMTSLSKKKKTKNGQHHAFESYNGEDGLDPLTGTFSPGATYNGGNKQTSANGSPKVSGLLSALKGGGGGSGGKDAKTRLQTLIQSVKLTNAMNNTLQSFGGESEASTSFAPTPARGAIKSLKTSNPNEVRRVKLLAGLQQFNLAVLVVGRGGDPGIHSVPGCTLSEEANILVEDVQREVTRRMQERKGIGLEAVEQKHKVETEKKLRPEESGQPTHQLFIREVLAFRCQQQHHRRVADVTVASPEKTLTTERLGPLLSVGQFVLVDKHSLYIPPRLTKKWVEKRLKLLRDREDQLAEGNIPSPLRMPHSPLLQNDNPLRAIPSIARMQLLAPSSFAKKGASRPVGAPNPHIATIDKQAPDAFGSLTVSRAHFGAGATDANNVSRSSNNFWIDAPMVTESGGTPRKGDKNNNASKRGRRLGGNLAPDQSVTFAITSSGFEAPLDRSLKRMTSTHSIAQSAYSDDRSTNSTSPKGADSRRLRSLMPQPARAEKKQGPKESAAFRASKGVGLESTICGEVMFVGTLRTFRLKADWHSERERQLQSLEDQERKAQLLTTSSPSPQRNPPPPPGLLLPKAISQPTNATDDNGGPGSALLSSRSDEDTTSNPTTSPMTSPGLHSADSQPTTEKTNTKRQRKLSVSLNDIEDEHLGDERMFVGLAVAKEHGNCDGRYLGDGVQYFDLPQGYGGLLLPMADVSELTAASDIKMAKNQLKRKAQKAVAAENVASESKQDSPFASFAAGRETKEHGDIPFSSHSKQGKGNVLGYDGEGGTKDWRALAQKTHSDMRRQIRAKQQEDEKMAAAVRATRHLH